MLLTKNCPWQALVDTAMDRWLTNPNLLRFSDMLANSNKAEQIACVLGKLNQQIENGGVWLWIDNGYAHDSINYLEEFLTECGPTGTEIWEILKPLIEKHMSEEGNIQNEDELPSEAISKQFCALQDKWHPEVYALLRRQQSVNRTSDPDTNRQREGSKPTPPFGGTNHESDRSQESTTKPRAPSPLHQ